MNDQGVRSEKDPDELEQEIDGTRSAITQKLEALEEKVRDTVQNAKETVEDTIHSARETVEETITTVKSSVEETVETVKRTFDLKLQVREHPWPMLGGSVLAGFALGNLLGGRSSPPNAYRPPASNQNGRAKRDVSVPQSYPAEKQPAALPSSPPSDGIRVLFNDEIQQVKGLAIGFLMSGIRDLVEQSMPQAKQEIHRLMNNITTKLGGTPVSGGDLQAHGANWR